MDPQDQPQIRTSFERGNESQRGSEEDFLEHLEATHAQAQMVGWDFSTLDGDLIADAPWWDYEADCLHALQNACIGALDLGTGGGERLSRLLESLSEESVPLPRVIATEGWPANVPVARTRLATQNVAVLEYDSNTGAPLDLPSRSLDLVMARHESYDAAEVARVLAPGGKLLSQQVHGLDAPEIHEWFGGEYLTPDVTAAMHTQALRDAGLRIDQVDEWAGTMQFSNAAALVTYIGLVPWDAPDFAVRAHASRLRELSAIAPIVVTQRRFRIYATKD